ncbi:TPA: GlsB/YeaQ/YmgE family stress response membrane protein [Enterococcus faecium]
MGFIWALIVGGIIGAIAGMAIIPSLIGAIILVLVVSFFARKL